MKIYHTFLLVLSLVFLTAFALLASIIDTKIIETFDMKIIDEIQEMKEPYLTSIMRFFSYIGNTVSVMIISLIILVILYIVFKQRKELILFIIVLVGSTGFNLLLKALFQRERPTLYTMIEEEGFSFPSGHSMAALSLYGIVSFLLWRHIPKKMGRVVLILTSTAFILIIGFSRIYLGAHFPSDIIGAYLFSGFWLLLCIWGFRNLQKRHSTQ